MNKGTANYFSSWAIFHLKKLKKNSPARRTGELDGDGDSFYGFNCCRKKVMTSEIELHSYLARRRFSSDSKNSSAFSIQGLSLCSF